MSLLMDALKKSEVTNSHDPVSSESSVEQENETVLDAESLSSEVKLSHPIELNSIELSDQRLSSMDFATASNVNAEQEIADLDLNILAGNLNNTELSSADISASPTDHKSEAYISDEVNDNRLDKARDMSDMAISLSEKIAIVTSTFLEVSDEESALDLSSDATAITDTLVDADGLDKHNINETNQVALKPIINKNNARLVRWAVALGMVSIISVGGYFYVQSFLEYTPDANRVVAPLPHLGVFDMESVQEVIPAVTGNDKPLLMADKKQQITIAPVTIIPKQTPLVRKKSNNQSTQPAKRSSTLPASTTVVVKKNARVDSVHLRLVQAYQHWQQGDNTAARHLYLEILQEERINRDALLGLAAIAVRQGQFDSARRYYTQLLQQNVKDKIALAGLVSLMGEMDSVAAESEIKTLLKDEPSASYLYFTLGNIYIQQTRWADAQIAFFNAYRLQNDNADYAYNLAISLDYLSEYTSAMTYYQRAIDLAAGRGAGFVADDALKRLTVLRQSSEISP